MSETPDFAAETVRMLYPEPWTITPTRARHGGEQRDFVLVPNTAGARMIVPARPRRLLATAMRRHAPGDRRTSARMKRLAFGALAASGAAGAGWPSRLHVGGSSAADSLEHWLDRRLGLAPCRLVIGLGRSRASRKPVVQVLDQAGAVRAYIKIGHDALSTSLVSTEAGVLAHLSRAEMRGVRVPRVLAYDEWNDLRLLALEPLPLSGASPEPEAVRDAAEQIAASAGRRMHRWRDSSFRARLIAQITSGGVRLAPLGDIVLGLDRTDPVIEFGVWHGDFNPGNFAAGPDGLLVWDWERYDHDVPVGFDMLHLALQRDIAFGGRDPREAAAGLLAGADTLLRGHYAGTAQRHHGHGPAFAARATGSDIVRLYLVWLACRYVRDGQDDAGTRLGEVERWILPALAASR